MNIATERKHLAAMIATTLLGLAVALAGLVAAAAWRLPWGWPLLVVGVVLGVGAQVGFILGVVRRAERV